MGGEVPEFRIDSYSQILTSDDWSFCMDHQVEVYWELKL